MEIHPFDEVADRAMALIYDGAIIYQQFECANCKTKQTMPESNKFWLQGICEECGHITDIKKDGMNFMLVKAYGGSPPK